MAQTGVPSRCQVHTHPWHTHGDHHTRSPSLPLLSLPLARQQAKRQNTRSQVLRVHPCQKFLPTRTQRCDVRGVVLRNNSWRNRERSSGALSVVSGGASEGSAATWQGGGGGEASETVGETESEEEGSAHPSQSVASASLPEGLGLNGLPPSSSLAATSAVGARPIPQMSVLAWLDAFWRFCRPHTVIGTTLSIISVSLLALAPPSSGYTLQAAVRGVLQALIPALCMNVYIVGLNQLFDIEIDKVNKPELPLASGEFSIPTGIIIVSAAAGISVGLGLLANSPPLLATLLVSMLLGTAYSIDVPGLRWKRFPVLAASCILAVRALVVQLGFYLHIQVSVLQDSQPALTVPLVFATAFMCLFSVVIALFKDIPDVQGDREFGILSLSVRMGQRKVYWLCVSILMLAYASAVVVSLRSHILWSKTVSVLGHMLAAGLLWRRAQNVEFGRPKSIYSVYMFVWKLFYAEYLILPLLRL